MGGGGDGVRWGGGSGEAGVGDEVGVAFLVCLFIHVYIV